MSTDPIDRALCCGKTCHRGTDATGPCVAATHGAGIRQRAEAAGYAVVSRPPRCGDHVLHRPSGEKWLVAWAEGGEIAWAGWPAGVAALSDCDILHRVNDAEHRAAVGEWANSNDDNRRARVLRLYGDFYG